MIHTSEKSKNPKSDITHHRLTVTVLLSNIKFYELCCFWCMGRCMSPLRRIQTTSFFTSLFTALLPQKLVVHCGSGYFT